MPTTKRTLDELAGLGGDIFDRQVRPVLRPEDDGKFVAIDVESGDYEMDEDDAEVIHEQVNSWNLANSERDTTPAPATMVLPCWNAPGALSFR